jgi:hypothetical protein
MSEVKFNLIDSYKTLHGTIHGSVADATVAALSAEPETIAELEAALARYIKPLDDSSPFATLHSIVHSSASCAADRPLDARPWDAGIVVIDLAARIVAVESTYSLPQAEGEVHYHDGTCATDIPVMYRLPDDWLFVNSVEAYQWSRERRTAERLAMAPLDVREVLYGVPLLDFIVHEFGKIDISKASTPAEHAEEHAAADHKVEYDGPDNDATENAIAGDAVANDAAANDDAAKDALAEAVSNIHARWLMTPREDLRGQSPREVLLARQDFIDFDMHTRTMQWSFQNEGPPCLAKNSFAYRFAGFGSHEFFIYYDLVRHLMWTLIDLRQNQSPTSNVPSPTSDSRTLTAHVHGLTPGDQNPFDSISPISNQHSTLESPTQLGMSRGQEGGLAPAPVLRGSSPTPGSPAGQPGWGGTIREGVRNQHSAPEPAAQLGISHGQEGGHAPALLSAGSSAAQTPRPRAPSPAMSAEREQVSTTCGPGSPAGQPGWGGGSGWVNDVVATLDQIKTTWLETPQPEYGNRIPAILIDNERKRLPEAMRPRDMIIDEDCPMCQMFGDETTPLGMGVGFWHLDGCNMDEDFAFSSYKTREEWEAENRRQEEFRKEFDRKWEERQQRIARGEILESDPFFDPDPFPGLELDDSSLIFKESIDDSEEFPQ